MSQAVKLSLDALYQIILPVFLVLGSGYVFGLKFYPTDTPVTPSASRRRRVASASSREDEAQQPATNGLRTLSSLIFYVLSPCLAFASLATSEIDAQEVGQIGLFALTTTLAIGAMAWASSRLLRLSTAETSSLLLVVMFGNVGNYGLPLNELAFGQQGLDRAVIYMVVSTVIIFSLGIAVAAHAQGGTPMQLLSQMTRIPVVYAILLAGLMRAGILPVPEPLLQAASILARGAVPLMLLILGMQLSKARVGGNWRLVSLASVLRLIVAPLIALPLAGLMGMTGLTRQVSVIEASMPSAVFAIILAIEFDLAQDLATGVVLVTMLISPATLVPLISYLR